MFSTLNLHRLWKPRRTLLFFFSMPVTRSKGLTASAEVEKIVTKVNKPRSAKPAKTARKSAPVIDGKSNIESIFTGPIPDDLLLPQDFVDYHEPEFIAGVKHVLSIDPSLYPVIVHKPFTAFAKSVRPQESEAEVIHRYWYELISSVIGQQVSGSAAKAIQNRFDELFDGKPEAAKVLNKSDEELRAVGLLGMKCKYVRHISEKFSTPCLLTQLSYYRECTKEDIIKELTQLKGIGEWSARMFSVFSLRELDVFAYDDLGVARGVARYLENRPELLAEIQRGVHAVEELKKRLARKGKFQTKTLKRTWTPLHDEYVKFLGLRYAPYQLVFMLIMWRLASTNIEVFENVR